MDLWLLATTRGIDGGDVVDLTRLGGTLGVDVAVFDWSDDSTVSPPLAILCSAATTTSAHHLDASARPRASRQAARRASESAREEVFADLLEPLQDSDLAVAILRHAATFAILDPNTSDQLSYVLLDRGTKAQNFSANEFESFWRLVGCAPALIFDLAQANWFENRGSGCEDEALVKGISNAWQWADVAAEGQALVGFCVVRVSNSITKGVAM